MHWSLVMWPRHEHWGFAPNVVGRDVTCTCISTLWWLARLCSVDICRHHSVLVNVTRSLVATPAIEMTIVWRKIWRHSKFLQLETTRLLIIQRASVWMRSVSTSIINRCVMIGCLKVYDELQEFHWNPIWKQVWTGQWRLWLFSANTTCMRLAKPECWFFLYVVTFFSCNLPQIMSLTQCHLPSSIPFCLRKIRVY